MRVGGPLKHPFYLQKTRCQGCPSPHELPWWPRGTTRVGGLGTLPGRLDDGASPPIPSLPHPKGREGSATLASSGLKIRQQVFSSSVAGLPTPRLFESSEGAEAPSEGTRQLNDLPKSGQFTDLPRSPSTPANHCTSLSLCAMRMLRFQEDFLNGVV